VLSKTLAFTSIWYWAEAYGDLKQVVQSDNLLLVELAMASLKNLSDEEFKISRLIEIIN